MCSVAKWIFLLEPQPLCSLKSELELKNHFMDFKWGVRNKIFCLTQSSEGRCYMRGVLCSTLEDRIFNVGSWMAIKLSGNSQHAFTRKKPSLITLSVICMHPGALGTWLHRFLRLLQPWASKLFPAAAPWSVSSAALPLSTTPAGEGSWSAAKNQCLEVISQHSLIPA